MPVPKDFGLKSVRFIPRENNAEMTIVDGGLNERDGERERLRKKLSKLSGDGKKCKDAK